MSSSTSTSETSDFYGKLLTYPRSPHPLFVIAFVAVIALGFAVSEMLVRTKPYFRHEVDIQLFDLAKVVNKHHRLLILGDSVSRTPLWGVHMRDDVMMLSASATVLPLGYELIARRYFEQGNVADETVIFLSPQTLAVPLESRYFDSHFGGVFTRHEERALVVERLGRDPYRSDGALSQRTSAVKAALTNYHGIPRRVRHVLPKDVVDNPIQVTEQPRSRALYENRKKKSGSNIFAVRDENLKFLRDLVDYLVSKNSKVTVAIVPMMADESSRFLSGPAGKLLESLRTEKKISVVNINDTTRFPTGAFFDGLHLDQVWQDRFVYIAQDIFGPLIADDAISTPSLFVPGYEVDFNDLWFLTGHTVKHRGIEGITSGRIDYTVLISEPGAYCLSAKALARSETSNSIRVELNLGEKHDWHFREIADEWKWYNFDQPFELSTGFNIFRFSEREGSPLSQVKLTKCDPVTSKRAALGSISP